MIAGKPTTIMPLQKLEKSCKKINCVMTMIVRPLERTVVLSFADDASGNVSAGDVGLSSDEEGMGRNLLTAPDLGSSVCNSSTAVVFVAMSWTDKKL